MKPVATVVAIAVADADGAAGAAARRDRPGPPPARRPDRRPAAALRLTAVDPRVVTAAGPDTLTVVGTLTNTGDVTGRRAGGPGAARQPAGHRGRGPRRAGRQRRHRRGHAAVRRCPACWPRARRCRCGWRCRCAAPADSSLALDATGVLRAAGQRQRRAGGRCPGPAGRRPDAAAGAVAAAGPGPAATPPPRTRGRRDARSTLLYPIADAPRRLPTVPGEPTLLTDDELATSLAPAGRLGGLVAALAGAPGRVRRCARATCLAVDPELVETVAAMSAATRCCGPDGDRCRAPGPPRPASGWTELTAVARGGCVVALPYADADLVALHRGGLDALATSAVTDGRAALAALLGAGRRPRSPGRPTGVVDERDPGRLVHAERARPCCSPRTASSRAGRRAAPGWCRSPPAASGRSSRCSPTRCWRWPRPADRRPQPAARAVPAPARSRPAPAGRGSPLATQDLIGALAFRARSGPDRSGAAGAAGPAARVGRRRAPAPPPCSTRSDRCEAGLLTPPAAGRGCRRRRPPTLRRRPVGLPAATPAAARWPVPVVDIGARAPRAAVADLRSAAVPDSGGRAEPGRGVRTRCAWACCGRRRRPGAGAPEAAAAAAALCAERIAELRGSVRVLEPPEPVLAGHRRRPAADHRGQRAPGHGAGQRLEIASRRAAGRRRSSRSRSRRWAGGRCGCQRQVTRGPVHGAGLGAHAGRRAARPTEPAAGALHRLRHHHRVADGERGRPARGAGRAPGGAPDPRGDRRRAPIPGRVPAAPRSRADGADPGRGGSSPPDAVPAGTPPASPTRPGAGPDPCRTRTAARTGRRQPRPTTSHRPAATRCPSRPRTRARSRRPATDRPEATLPPDRPEPCDRARASSPVESTTPSRPPDRPAPDRPGRADAVTERTAGGPEPSLGRASRMMAIASLASRITGFLRRSRWSRCSASAWSTTPTRSPTRCPTSSTSCCSAACSPA